MSRLYLIGSLRNPAIPQIGQRLRAAGFDVFDDWYAAGPEADDKWKEYECARGRTYIEALDGEAAQHVFDFDRRHLLSSDAVVLVMPAGKSACLELGWILGRGIPGYVIMDTPDRWDVMMKFATAVYPSIDAFIKAKGVR